MVGLLPIGASADFLLEGLAISCVRFVYLCIIIGLVVS
jgi:hypothetical protein